jgi:protein O-GlcNAc transferase
MDYFISAADWETPQADSHYSERLIRLEHLPMYCRAPDLSGMVFDRAQFGLPSDATIYSCPQSLFKIHPDFDSAMGGLLRRDRNGLVVLLTGQHPEWNRSFVSRFARTFADVVNRVVFMPKLPRQNYLSLFAASDAVLDPFHWGGGNTTIEALACGVPVPTLPGEFMRGRLTLGFYRKLGMDELVVDSPEEFVELNFRLANDRELRAGYQARLTQRLPVLYEDGDGLRELQSFFLAAVRARRGAERPVDDCSQSRTFPAPDEGAGTPDKQGACNEEQKARPHSDSSEAVWRPKLLANRIRYRSE